MATFRTQARILGITARGVVQDGLILGAQFLVSLTGALLPLPTIVESTTKASQVISEWADKVKEEREKAIISLKQSDADLQIKAAQHEQESKTIAETTEAQRKEVEVKGQSARVENQGKHFDTMKVINEDLATKSKISMKSATESQESYEKATKAVEQLTDATKELDKAYGKLYDAINKYDLTKLEGTLAIEAAKDIQQTMMEVLISESKLNTKLATSTIQNESIVKQTGTQIAIDKGNLNTQLTTERMTNQAMLQQQISQDVAEKNIKLDKLLANLSLETLEQIASITIQQITKEHEEMTQDPTNIEQRQAHVSHLESLLSKTEKIINNVKEKEIAEHPAEPATHAAEVFGKFSQQPKNVVNLDEQRSMSMQNRGG